LKSLYAIVNLESSTEPLPYIEALVASGASVIQLREKRERARELLEIASAAVEICRRYDCKLIINDRVDIAMLSKADGVHLGQRDLAPSSIRALAGEKLLVGLSTHNLEQVRQAQREPVNYLGFGPIFHSATKSGHAPLCGIELLAEAAELSTLPLVAIGGINFENAKSALEAGAKSVAMVSELVLCYNEGSLVDCLGRLHRQPTVN